jgi:hypothetical protein
MSKTGFSRLLILGTDVIPNIDGNDRGLVIFVNQQSEAIVEMNLLARDFQL